MRPDVLFPLFSEVRALKGAGPATVELLNRLTGISGVPRLRDLLFHLPVAYTDRRYSPPLNQAKDGEIITVKLTVEAHEAPRATKGGNTFGRPYKVLCRGEGGLITLIFFNARPDYISRSLPVGAERIVSGRFEQTGYGWQMTHPDFIVPVNELEKIRIVEPLYPLTTGLSNKQLRKLIDQIWPRVPELPEWQDRHWMASKQWPAWRAAWEQLHHPQNPEDLQLTHPARERIAYDEILANQLALALVRRRLKKPLTHPLPPPGDLRRKALQALPFKLTGAQIEVLKEIDDDLSGSHRMLRLLQGDVGSGKTVIALLAMLRMAEAGRQSALMVPTEILAQQHLRFVQSICEKIGVPVAVLTGSLKSSEQQKIRERIKNGEALIVVGTHSLFQGTVEFKDLGLIVVDEQHRFGVEQRMVFAEKGHETHILQMTATPIPRSLTMTAFGDMDVSLLTEKPKGRPPIHTSAVPRTRQQEVIEGLRRAIDTGDRVYWICPLIEESGDDMSKSDLAAAKARFIEFQQIFKDRVGLMHGKLPAAQREEAMRDFASGKLSILIATTVIEVGVDVPEATIIVIEQAERFGLAQLHQLRGRVGRGTKPSHCILVYAEKTGEIAKRRLRTIRDTDDGFKIAEEDLRLRGAGDILGTKQSGVPDFRFADLGMHADLVLAARDDVKLILQQDSELSSSRGQALRVLLYLFGYDENIQLLKAG